MVDTYAVAGGTDAAGVGGGGKKFPFKVKSYFGRCATVLPPLSKGISETRKSQVEDADLFRWSTLMP